MLCLRLISVIAILVLAPASISADEAKAKQIAAAKLELLTTFRKEFIAITPGKGRFPAQFTMGQTKGAEAERPAHQVSLDDNFSIARYEVPQNLWEAVMGSNPSRWKGSRNSVEKLSFDEAVRFCDNATRAMRAAKLIKPNQVVRLPSEAEWEYCARAGTKTRYSFGDDVKQLDAHAWHTGNAAGNDPPVGAKKPNPWGLYDFHGYLWEWCTDAWHPNYKDAPTDGSARVNGSGANKRVVRGGSWKDKADALTSSHRRGVSKDLRDDAVGLRCVLAVEK